MNFLKLQQNKKRGVTIFFAILVIGLLLGIGASVSLLSQKQIALSSLSKQSELAFYAADSGVECVEYYDKNADAFNYATTGAADTILCNKTNITICDNNDNTKDSCQSPSKSFTMNFGSACASTTVQKTPVNGVNVTSITSYGYNDCAVNGGKRLERAIQLTY